MAAPIYSQEQVSAMIATPKSVKHDAWQERSAGRAGTAELRDRIPAHPIDESDLTEFVIETCRCIARGEASFTLFGKLAGYPEQALCRYEVQICRHANPKWFLPSMIGPRVLHKHVYSERAIREDWTWDKCAEPLKQHSRPRRKLTLQQCIDRLAPIFLQETNVKIHDADSMGLFGR
jgi:hypothetical protein